MSLQGYFLRRLALKISITFTHLFVIHYNKILLIKLFSLFRYYSAKKYRRFFKWILNRRSGSRMTTTFVCYFNAEVLLLHRIWHWVWDINLTLFVCCLKRANKKTILWQKVKRGIFSFRFLDSIANNKGLSNHVSSVLLSVLRIYLINYQV